MKLKLSANNVKKLQPSSKPFEVNDTEIAGFILRIQPSGIMTYYISYRVGVTRKRYKIGKHGNVSPVQARDIAEKLAGKIVNGEDVQAVKTNERHIHEKNQLKTLKSFLEIKYAPWLRSDRKTADRALKQINTNFKEFLNMPLEEITPWTVEKWRVNELENGKKAATVNRNLTRLRAILAKAVEWEHLTNHPLKKLKPLKEDNEAKIRYLTTDEKYTLRQCLDKRELIMIHKRKSANTWREERGYKLFPDLQNQVFADYLKPMVLVSINTGLRQGELFSLTWSNINFERAILTILASSSKSRKSRHIPLNTEALATLKNWREQTPPSLFVFPSKNESKFNNLRKSWHTLLAKAGITDFRWHDLRHHFASRLVMAGVDLNTVRELLGHSDIKMTLRYAHLAPEHKAAAVAKLANYSSSS